MEDPTRGNALLALLALTILLSWIISIRGNGLLGLSSAMLLGFTAYSTPVFFGFYLWYGRYGLSPMAVGEAATQVLLWAWVSLLAAQVVVYARRALAASRSSPSRLPVESYYDVRARLFCLICLALALALYLWIAVLDSPLYFLAERQVDQVQAELQKLIWRWVILFGLISALIVRSRGLVLCFVLFLSFHFIAGDRTMILISAVSVAVYFFAEERDVRRLMRLDLVLLFALSMILILAGKPIYHAAKMQSIAPIELMISPRYGTIAMSFFEPLLTHTILEDVLRHNFQYSFRELLAGSLGQFLVMPSLFGIDSSAFNVKLQTTLYPRVGFGVANHYFAQGWSVAGWAGVGFFSLLLVLSIEVLSQFMRRVSPLPRILLVIVGVVIGTYFFRNSIENLLSLLRQVVLVGVLLLLLTQAAWALQRHRSAGLAAAASVS